MVTEGFEVDPEKIKYEYVHCVRLSQDMIKLWSH
jgi:hypothetical protein